MDRSFPKLRMKRFIGGMVMYTITIFVGTFLAARIERSVWTYFWTLLPALPFTYAMANIFSGIRQQDELQRRIHLESILITAFVALGFSFVWGLMEYGDLVPHFPTFLFGPGMIGVWGITNGIISRRYQ